jgi:hypothetical protein
VLAEPATEEGVGVDDQDPHAGRRTSKSSNSPAMYDWWAELSACPLPERSKRITLSSLARPPRLLGLVAI